MYKFKMKTIAMALIVAVLFTVLPTEFLQVWAMEPSCTVQVNSVVDGETIYVDGALVEYTIEINGSDEKIATEFNCLTKTITGAEETVSGSVKIDLSDYADMISTENPAKLSYCIEKDGYQTVSGAVDFTSVNDQVTVELIRVNNEVANDIDEVGSELNRDKVFDEVIGEEVIDETANDLDAFTPEAVAEKDGSIINLAVTDGQDASAYFHATITSSKDTYSSGSTAIYSVKYKIDRGNIHGGDFVYVTVPKDLVSSVEFSVPSQHFSSVEDRGNGKYKLMFAEGAESSLSGSFSMFFTTAEVEEQKTGTVSVGKDSSSITVNPKGPSDSGSSVYNDTIMKDAIENDGAVGYGGYDYSEGWGDSAAQIGILKRNPGNIKYRLYVNNKQAEISNIVVTDILPDGMEFDPQKNIEVLDRYTGEEIDASMYQVSLSENKLVFTYLGTLTSTIQINYWVILTSDEPLSGKFTNRADITYEQGGVPYAEHRNYILQGSNYNAVNGEKSVDKTEISTAPEDQMVTYTIKFWNQNGFSTGEIVLDDVLDPYVKFISANVNDYFSIEQDEDNPQIIHLKNIKDISGTITVYVRFICDFSDVPVGYTVKNTVGGNTTKTKKIGGEVTLSAVKTVDGNNPTDDQVFEFELLDSDGTVLQTKTNAGRNILFDSIPYAKDDLGKTYTYQIREKSDQQTDYSIDDTVYTAIVVVDDEVNADGNIGTTVTYKKEDSVVEEATFNNMSAQISIPVTKVWNDCDDQDSVRPNEVRVKLMANKKDTGKTMILNKNNDWQHTFTDLPKNDDNGAEIQYTIEEMDVEGYISEITGSVDEGFIITNTRVASSTITLGKLVEGNGGDKEKAFTFNINLSDCSVPQTFEVTPGVIDGSGAESPAISKLHFDDSGHAIVELKHGQQITIHIPDDKITYDIVEEEILSNGYEMSIDGLSDSVAELRDDAGTLIGVRGTTSEDDKIIITNTKNIVIPTGIHINVLPSVIAVSISFLMILYLILKKKTGKSV